MGRGKERSQSGPATRVGFLQRQGKDRALRGQSRFILKGLMRIHRGDVWLDAMHLLREIGIVRSRSLFAKPKCRGQFLQIGNALFAEPLGHGLNGGLRRGKLSRILFQKRLARGRQPNAWAVGRLDLMLKQATGKERGQGVMQVEGIGAVLVEHKIIARRDSARFVQGLLAICLDNG